MTRIPFALSIFALLVSACASSPAASPRDAAPARDAATAVDAADAESPQDSGPPDLGRADAGRPVVCGDSVCTSGVEDCRGCPIDCGECPRCDLAPTCTGALSVPTVTAPLAGCDNVAGSDERTSYACGVGTGRPPADTSCTDPQLRMRVREISSQRGFFDVPRELYCVISAEDGAHSELVFTTPRQVAGNRTTTTLNFRPSEALFWGQGDLHRSIANVTITYQCFLTSDGAAAMRVLDDISNRAAMVAERADGYGWVFGTAAVVGTILGSALGTTPDTLVLDVQQTIDADALLEMTNGRRWEIRRRRGNLDLSGASDVRLSIESWGCAGVRPRLP